MLKSKRKFNSQQNQVLPKVKTTLRLDVLLNTKTPRFEQFSTTRNEADHFIFYNLCQEVYKGIPKEIFLPNPSWNCRDC